MSKRDTNRERDLRRVQTFVGLGLVIGLALIVAGERIGSSVTHVSTTDSVPQRALPESGTTGSR
jgi:hypothetical protein